MRNSLISALILITMCLIWAGNYFAIKLALSGTDAVTIAFLRASMGGAFVLALAGRSIFSFRAEDIKWIAAVGLFNVSIFLILLNAGLETASPAVASVLVYTAPVWVVAFSPMIGERMSSLKIVGIGGAFAGILLIFLPSLLKAHMAEGDIYEFMAAISWALAILIFKKWHPHAGTYAVTGTQNAAGTLFMLPLMLTGNHHISVRPVQLLYLLYIVVVATSIAYILYFHLLSRMGASEFSSYLFLVPLFTIALTPIISGTTPSINVIVGACLVGSGIFAVNRDSVTPAMES